MTDKPIRVAVADKNPLVRAGLRQLLGEDKRFEHVGECENGTDFLRMAQGLDFSVGVIGWVMPNGDGKFVLDQIGAIKPDARIVIYTGADDDAFAAQAMLHGAAALVLKSESTDYLLDTLEVVARGRMVFPYVDIQKLQKSPLLTLTRREKEVLAALAAGRSNKEIAQEQNVAPNTVKFHLKNLYEKLGVSNRAQAVSVYLQS